MTHLKLSAATQKLGQEFSRTETAQLPNGKKLGYPVSGTDYSLYYGAELNALATIGPVDISSGLSWLTRGSDRLLNARLLVGGSLWVNDIFEVRALSGFHILSKQGDTSFTRNTLGFSLEVLCPVSDQFSVNLAYSPSISGDQMLTLGVGFLLTAHLPKERVRRKGIETALVQATQTLNNIRESLNADNINAVAAQYREPGQITFRRIAALRNAVNYMLFPKYPWRGQDTMGFSDMVAKAKGEVVFAKSLASHDQDDVIKLEQEIDNLPNQLADTLASDIALDKYGVLSSLQEMVAQHPERLNQGAAILGEYVDNYNYVVRSLENIATDPVWKKKIQIKTMAVLKKLDELDQKIQPLMQKVEPGDPTL